MFHKPNESINIAEIEYQVIEHIVIPQGFVLFCQSPFNTKVVIKESGLMGTQEQDLIRNMFNSQFRNVAEVSDYYHYGKRQYYIMKSSDITLQRLMLESPKDMMRQAGFILKQIISGIVELHKFGWIHREIEEKNIIIESDQNYKLSMWPSFLDIWNAQTRSRDYFSETQYQGIVEAHLNVQKNYKIDYWAFGVLAFKLYTGIDFKIQNKYSPSQIDYQEIRQKVCMNQASIDSDIYSLLLEIFDFNSQQKPAIMENFMDYQVLQRINIAKIEYNILDSIVFQQGRVLFCKYSNNTQLNQKVVIREFIWMDVAEEVLIKNITQSCKYINKVSDIYFNGFRKYYVMESSDLTLEQQIQESPLEIMKQARFILKQIIFGIRDLHEIGWVHMQIAANSIIVDRKYDDLKNYQDVYKLSMWQSFQNQWNIQRQQNEYRYSDTIKAHQNIQNNYKIDLWAFGLLAIKLFTGSDFKVQDKNFIYDGEFEAINKLLSENQFNFDFEVLTLLSEIFDKNSQKTAAEIAQMFQTQRRLSGSIIVRRTFMTNNHY